MRFRRFSFQLFEIDRFLLDKFHQLDGTNVYFIVFRRFDLTMKSYVFIQFVKINVLKSYQIKTEVEDLNYYSDSYKNVLFLLINTLVLDYLNMHESGTSLHTFSQDVKLIVGA